MNCAGPFEPNTVVCGQSMKTVQSAGFISGFLFGNESFVQGPQAVAPSRDRILGLKTNH